MQFPHNLIFIMREPSSLRGDRLERSMVAITNEWEISEGAMGAIIIEGDRVWRNGIHNHEGVQSVDPWKTS